MERQAKNNSTGGPAGDFEATQSAALDHPPQPLGLASLRTDRLAYLADMISELQVMAHETQCHTLAGILGLAHNEARQQMRAAV